MKHLLVYDMEKYCNIHLVEFKYEIYFFMNPHIRNITFIRDGYEMSNRTY